MNILFVHRSFPAQFQYLSLVLANNPKNNVVFIAEEDCGEIPNVKKVIYKLDKEISKDCHPCLVRYEQSIIIAQAVADAALKLKNEGFKPDVIYGFSAWGSTMFLKDVFPDVPLISYCEWFGFADGPESKFDGRVFDEKDREKIRCGNSNLLIDLYSCDAAITPTQWQKQQFPKEFHDKIRVIHDGIDVITCKPDAEAKFLIPEKNLELTIKDEVVTYGTRALELYRGFPQFMQTVEKLLKKRPNTQVIVAGDDVTCYGSGLENETYKNLALKELDIDLERVHFVGKLNFLDYIKLLQISSVHVYLTYPYILSWSMLNAMSTGCCVVASNTPPVGEVIQDNYNGLLVDFFNINQIVEKIEYALDNQDKVLQIRNNARQTVLDKYELKKLVLQQISFLMEVVAKN
ncbi:MAG: glycosyltransferase [Candidatus Gastranaerophilales bacterium]|nr:glycosyltransferase [Candidatus Gastranaerophilales bacterium]